MRLQGHPDLRSDEAGEFRHTGTRLYAEKEFRDAGGFVLAVTLSARYDHCYNGRVLQCAASSCDCYLVGVHCR